MRGVNNLDPLTLCGGSASLSPFWIGATPIHLLTVVSMLFGLDHDTTLFPSIVHAQASQHW